MIRVFPRKTKWTPIDDLAFIGDPPLFRPADQPVKISVTFTWDIPEGQRLCQAWNQYYSDVQMGGPALDDPGNDFVPERFLKPGIVITSRGCFRKCPWCLVPQREGEIRQLPIKDGWDIADNNLLGCSKSHITEVFEMLLRQPKPARFSGGLDARLFKEWHINLIDKIRLKYLWFACDYPEAEKPLSRVAEMLSHISIEKKRCYVLIGYGGDSLYEAEKRCEMVYQMGFLPFAMLFRGSEPIRRCEEWPRDWIELQAKWTQPKIYKNQASDSCPSLTFIN